MQHRRSLFLGVLSVLFVQAPLSHSQQLMTGGDTGRHTALAPADIKILLHIKVSTTASGASATLEAVAVRAVLEKPELALGKASEESDWRSAF
jgi:hypothetical protein